MDIVLTAIGHLGFGFDYTGLQSWEASLKTGPEMYNVGVVENTERYGEAFQKFVVQVNKYGAEGNFVLVTDAGVVLASEIADNRDIIHKEIPEDNGPKYSYASTYYEDIARTHIQSRLDELDRSTDRSEVGPLFRTTYETLAKIIA